MNFKLHLEFQSLCSNIWQSRWSFSETKKQFTDRPPAIRCEDGGQSRLSGKHFSQFVATCCCKSTTSLESNYTYCKTRELLPAVCAWWQPIAIISSMTVARSAKYPAISAACSLTGLDLKILLLILVKFRLCYADWCFRRFSRACSWCKDFRQWCRPFATPIICCKQILHLCTERNAPQHQWCSEESQQNNTWTAWAASSH